ncbi:MAG: exopolyphosphatase [Actinobacteria bacterium]|nr:exopolyphosphatase [Actinomycetota bacterium]
MKSVAVIDCGTNSTRILIVDGDGRTLAREMTITRLGEGVAQTGILGDAALDRVFTCLTRYRTIMDTFGVSEGKLVATSAARDAANGPEFLVRCEAITGITPVLLSGAEEATASYIGATADLEPSTLPVMIIDIGGGSTELACRVNGAMVAFSMQLGCVRVSEAAFHQPTVTSDEADEARVMIVREIDRMFAAVPAFSDLVGAVRLVGLAGTVATIAQMDAGISEYDRNAVHHRILRRSDVQRWYETLAAETASERLLHAGMVPGREDVLVGGLLVLDAVMARFGISELLSSECDILDGVAAQLQGRA